MAGRAATRFEIPSLSFFLHPELPGEIATCLAEADLAAIFLCVLTMVGNEFGSELHVLTPDGAERSGQLFEVVVGEAGGSRTGTGVGNPA